MGVPLSERHPNRSRGRLGWECREVSLWSNWRGSIRPGIADWFPQLKKFFSSKSLLPVRRQSSSADEVRPFNLNKFKVMWALTRPSSSWIGESSKLSILGYACRPPIRWYGFNIFSILPGLFLRDLLHRWMPNSYLRRFFSSFWHSMAAFSDTNPTKSENWRANLSVSLR